MEQDFLDGPVADFPASLRLSDGSVFSELGVLSPARQAVSASAESIFDADDCTFRIGRSRLTEAQLGLCALQCTVEVKGQTAADYVRYYVSSRIASDPFVVLGLKRVTEE